MALPEHDQPNDNTAKLTLFLYSYHLTMPKTHPRKGASWQFINSILLPENQQKIEHFTIKDVSRKY
jgi:hypothetical protein